MTENLGNALTAQCMLGDELDDVTGIPAAPAVQTNQRALKGRENLNGQCLIDWVPFNVL